MKEPILAVETGPALRRAALMRAGRLEALEIDRLGETRPLPGAIYRCRITGLIAGLGAAVADLGGGENGFLPDATGLTEGDSLLVSVRRAAEPGKAARLSPAVELASDHLVFTPRRPGINVSRKIADEDARARLRDALAPFAPQGGFVIRTGALDVPSDTLAEEAAALVARHDRLAADTAPGLRAPAPDAVARLIGRMGPPAAIVADDASRPLLPDGPSLRLDPAPFEALDLDAALTALRGPRHDLAEGWVSIDPTPALVAVDVNTGDAARGRAAVRVNLDAARTVPRLLSLRHLGGPVLVDFAAAPKGDDRARLADAFRDAASRYLVEARVLGWGPAGLLETVCRRPARPLDPEDIE